MGWLNFDMSEKPFESQYTRCVYNSIRNIKAAYHGKFIFQYFHNNSKNFYTI